MGHDENALAVDSPLTVHIGNVMNEEMARADLQCVTFVDQATKVGITSDQWV
jgi:hypothetical protein